MHFSILSLLGAFSTPTLRWDASATAGLQEGAGTWDAATTDNFTANDGATRVVWNAASPFRCGGAASGTAGTVTVSGGVSAAGMKFFVPFAGQYTLSASTITLTAPTVDVDSGATPTIGSIIAGSVGLTKMGAGNLTLSGINTNSGGWTVDGGKLILSNGGPAGCIRGTVTANTGTTLDTTIADAFGYASDTVKVTRCILIGATLDHTGTGNCGWGVDFELSGGAIMQSNGGTASTSASSRFAFGGLSNAAGDRTTVTTSGNSQCEIKGRIDLRTDNSVTGADFIVANGTAPVDLLVSAGITGGGGLVKTGTGVLKTTFNNTYTGATAVNAGEMQITGTNGSSAFTVASGATLSGDAATTGTTGALAFSALASKLAANAITTSSVSKLSCTTLTAGSGFTVDALGTLNAGTYDILVSTSGTPTPTLGTNTTGQSSVNFAWVANTLQLTASTGLLDLQWDISGSAGMQNGAGTWDVGTTSNWTANGGTSNVTWTNGSKATICGNGATGNADTITISGSPTFDTLTLNTVPGGTLDISGSIGLVTDGKVVANAALTTLSTVFTGSVGMEKSGTGVIRLTGASTYTGGTDILAGEIRLGSGGTTGSIGSGAIAISASALLSVERSNVVTITENLTGAGAFENRGTGSTVLNGTGSTLSGGITVTSGIVQIGTANAATIGNGPIAVAASAEIIFNSTAANTVGAITGSGDVNFISTGVVSIATPPSATNELTFNGGALKYTGGNTTFSSNIIFTAGNSSIELPTGTTETFAGTISGAGTFIKKGEGSMHIIGGTWPHTGTIDIQNGLFYVAAQTLTFGDVITSAGTATTQFYTGGYAQHLKSISGSGGSLFIAGGNLSVKGSTTDTYAGDIKGSGSFERRSTGTTILTGTNTITGAVNVTEDGQLGGTGSLTACAMVTTNSSTTIFGGTGAGNAGTLSTSGLEISGKLQVNIGSVTTVSKIAVTGNLTLSGNPVTFQATALNAGTYDLFTYTGTQSGTLAAPTLTGTGRTFTSYSYSGGIVSVTLA